MDVVEEQRGNPASAILIPIVLFTLVVLISFGIAYLAGAFDSPEPTANTETPPPPPPEPNQVIEPVEVAEIDLDALRDRLKCADDVEEAKCEQNKTEFVNLLKSSAEQIQVAAFEAATLNAMSSKSKTNPEFQVQQERAFATAGWLGRTVQLLKERAKRLGIQDDSAYKARLEQAEKVRDDGFEVANRLARRDKFNRVIHATKSIGDIVCPPNFNTMYSRGVNEAANCPDVDALCNRCIGFAFPEKTVCTSGTQWNGNEWAEHKGPATEPKNGQGGRVMSYDGIYVADGHEPDFGRC